MIFEWICGYLYIEILQKSLILGGLLHPSSSRSTIERPAKKIRKIRVCGECRGGWRTDSHRKSTLVARQPPYTHRKPGFFMLLMTLCIFFKLFSLFHRSILPLIWTQIKEFREILVFFKLLSRRNCIDVIFTNFIFFVLSGVVIHGHITKNIEYFRISCDLLPASKGFFKVIYT